MAPRTDFNDDEIETDDDGNEYVRIPVDQAKAQRELARKAKDADAITAERDAAQRELAFFKAGVPDTALGKLFVKGYDGDLTAEAITAAAAEIPGLLATPDDGTGTPDPTLTAEQQAAAAHDATQTEARNALARGAGAPGVPPELNGQQQADKVVADMRAENRRNEVGQATGIASLATAALKGDTSVLVKERTF